MTYEIESDEDLMHKITSEIYKIICRDNWWIIDDSEKLSDWESLSSESDYGQEEDNYDEEDISCDITKNTVFKKIHCTPLSRHLRYVRRRMGEKMT